MSFVSITFLAFLAIALVVYWNLGSDRWRQRWLLLTNFIFYGWWDWRFTGLLASVILISHFAALQIYTRAGDRCRQKQVLFVACAALVGLLGIFKYCNFFMDSLKSVTAHLGVTLSWTTLHIILPVGISFYIFQGLSYVISVYQRRVPAEKSIVKVGMYLSFFPHLVAGPIIHATYFLPQLASIRKYDSRQALEGCRRFVWGLIYKAVFADNLAPYVDWVFRNPSERSSLETLAGCLGFYGQIYFDFAGYSLMAIGIANLFGYELPENFRFPYRAGSMINFWRRWHISLSTWLRDYIYIPLGGNRGTHWFQYRIIMYTMLLGGGLWHGASWNFIVWGALHGAALCVNHLWGLTRLSTSARLSAGTCVFLTQVTVMLLWIPFRANNAVDSLVILDALLVWQGTSTQPIPWLFIIAPLLADTWLVGAAARARTTTTRPPVLLYASIVLAAIVALLFMYEGNMSFIYFQF